MQAELHAKPLSVAVRRVLQRERDVINVNMIPLSMIDPVPNAHMIKTLVLSHTSLATTDGLQQFSSLREVFLAHNPIESLQSLLSGFPVNASITRSVEVISCVGCPVALVPGYRETLLSHFPNLTHIDTTPISASLRHHLTLIPSLSHSVPLLFSLYTRAITASRAAAMQAIHAEMRLCRDTSDDAGVDLMMDALDDLGMSTIAKAHTTQSSSSSSSVSTHHHPHPHSRITSNGRPRLYSTPHTYAHPPSPSVQASSLPHTLLPTIAPPTTLPTRPHVLLSTPSLAPLQSTPSRAPPRTRPPSTPLPPPPTNTATSPHAPPHALSALPPSSRTARTATPSLPLPLTPPPPAPTVPTAARAATGSTTTTVPSTSTPYTHTNDCADVLREKQRLRCPFSVFASAAEQCMQWRQQCEELRGGGDGGGMDVCGDGDATFIGGDGNDTLVGGARGRNDEITRNQDSRQHDIPESRNPREKPVVRGNIVDNSVNAHLQRIFSSYSDSEDEGDDENQRLQMSIGKKQDSMNVSGIVFSGNVTLPSGSKAGVQRSTVVSNNINSTGQPPSPESVDDVSLSEVSSTPRKHDFERFPHSTRVNSSTNVYSGDENISSEVNMISVDEKQYFFDIIRDISLGKLEFEKVPELLRRNPTFSTHLSSPCGLIAFLDAIMDHLCTNCTDNHLSLPHSSPSSSASSPSSMPSGSLSIFHSPLHSPLLSHHDTLAHPLFPSFASHLARRMQHWHNVVDTLALASMHTPHTRRTQHAPQTGQMSLSSRLSSQTPCTTHTSTEKQASVPFTCFCEGQSTHSKKNQFGKKYTVGLNSEAIEKQPYNPFAGFSPIPKRSLPRTMDSLDNTHLPEYPDFLEADSTSFFPVRAEVSLDMSFTHAYRREKRQNPGKLYFPQHLQTEMYASLPEISKFLFSLNSGYVRFTPFTSSTIILSYSLYILELLSLITQNLLSQTQLSFLSCLCLFPNPGTHAVHALTRWIYSYTHESLAVCSYRRPQDQQLGHESHQHQHLEELNHQSVLNTGLGNTSVVDPTALIPMLKSICAMIPHILVQLPKQVTTLFSGFPANIDGQHRKNKAILPSSSIIDVDRRILPHPQVWNRVRKWENVFSEAFSRCTSTDVSFSIDPPSISSNVEHNGIRTSGIVSSLFSQLLLHSGWASSGILHPLVDSQARCAVNSGNSVVCTGSSEGNGSIISPHIRMWRWWSGKVLPKMFQNPGSHFSEKDFSGKKYDMNKAMLAWEMLSRWKSVYFRNISTTTSFSEPKPDQEMYFFRKLWNFAGKLDQSGSHIRSYPANDTLDRDKEAMRGANTKENNVEESDEEEEEIDDSLLSPSLRLSSLHVAAAKAYTRTSQRGDRGPISSKDNDSSVTSSLSLPSSSSSSSSSAPLRAHFALLASLVHCILQCTDHSSVPWPTSSSLSKHTLGKTPENPEYVLLLPTPPLFILRITQIFRKIRKSQFQKIRAAARELVRVCSRIHVLREEERDYEREGVVRLTQKILQDKEEMKRQYDILSRNYEEMSQELSLKLNSLSTCTSERDQALMRIELLETDMSNMQKMHASAMEQIQQEMAKAVSVVQEEKLRALEKMQKELVDAIEEAQRQKIQLIADAETARVLAKEEAETAESLAIQERESARLAAVEECRSAARERDEILAQCEKLRRAYEELERTHEEVLRERDQAILERNEALAERDTLLLERDGAFVKRDAALAECDIALASRDQVIQERDAAFKERDAALAEYLLIKQERDAALLERNAALLDRNVALADLGHGGAVHELAEVSPEGLMGLMEDARHDGGTRNQALGNEEVGLEEVDVAESVHVEVGEVKEGRSTNVGDIAEEANGEVVEIQPREKGSGEEVEVEAAPTGLVPLLTSQLEHVQAQLQAKDAEMAERLSLMEAAMTSELMQIMQRLDVCIAERVAVGAELDRVKREYECYRAMMEAGRTIDGSETRANGEKLMIDTSDDDGEGKQMSAKLSMDEYEESEECGQEEQRTIEAESWTEESADSHEDTEEEVQHTTIVSSSEGLAKTLRIELQEARMRMLEAEVEKLRMGQGLLAGEVKAQEEIVGETSAEATEMRSQRARTRKGTGDVEVEQEEDEILAQHTGELAGLKAITELEAMLVVKNDEIEALGEIIQAKDEDLRMKVGDYATLKQEYDAHVEKYTILTQEQATLLDKCKTVMRERDDVANKCILATQERDEAVEKCSALTRELDEALQRYATVIEKRDGLLDTYASTVKENDATMQRHAVLMNEHSILTRQHSTLTEEHSVLQQEYSTLLQRHSTLTAEYATLEQQYPTLESAYETLMSTNSALRSEYTSLVDEHSHLEHEHATLREEHSSLKHELGTVTGEYSTLKEQYSMLDGKFTTLSDEYTTLQGDNSTLRDELLSVKSDYSTLESEIATLKHTHLSLLSEHSALSDKHATLATECEEMTRKYTSLATSYEAVSAEVGAKTRDLSSISEELRELREKYDTLLHTHDDMRQRCVTAMQDYESLMKKHAALMAENADYVDTSHKYTLLVGKHTEMEEKYTTLLTSNTELAQIHATLITENTTLAHEYTSLLAAHATLTETYSTLTNTHATVTSEHSTLVDAHATLGEEHSALVAAHTALTSEYSKLTAAHGTLTEEHSAMSAAHTALLSEHSELTTTHASLISEHSTLVDTHATLMSEYATLTDTHADLVSQYATLNNSHTALTEEHSTFMATHTSLVSEHLALSTTHTRLMTEHSTLLAAHTALTEEHFALTTAHSALMSEHSSLTATHNTLTEKHTTLIDANIALVEERAALTATHTTLASEHSTLEVNYSDLQREKMVLFEENADLRSTNVALESKNLELMQRNEELNSKNADHERINDDFEAKLTESMRVNKELEDKYIALARSREKMEEEHSELLRVHATLETEHRELIDEKEALVGEHNELLQKFAKLEQEYVDLVHSAEMLAAGRAELLSSKDSLETKLAELLCMKDSVETERDELLCVRDAIEAKNSALQHAKDEIEAENSELQRGIATMETNYCEMMRAKDLLEAENAELRDVKAKLERELRELTDGKEMLGYDHKELMREKHELEEKYTGLACDKIKLEERHAELRQIHEKLVADHAELMQAKGKVESDQRELMRVHAEVEEELNVVKGVKAVLLEELETCKAQLQIRNAEFETCKVELEARESELGSYKTEIDRFKLDVEADRAELEARKVEIDGYKAAMEALKAEVEECKVQCRAELEKGRVESRAEVEAHKSKLAICIAEAETCKVNYDANIEAYRVELDHCKDKVEASKLEIEACEIELKAALLACEEAQKLKDETIDKYDKEKAKREEIMLVCERERRAYEEMSMECARVQQMKDEAVLANEREKRLHEEAVIAYEKEKKLRRDVEEARDKIMSVYEDAKAQVLELQRRLEEKVREAERLEVEKKEMEENIKALSQDIEKLHSQVSLERQLSLQRWEDMHVSQSALTEALERSLNTIKSLKNGSMMNESISTMIDDHNKNVLNLSQLLAERSNSIDVLQHNIHDMEVEIATLKLELSDKNRKIAALEKDDQPHSLMSTIPFSHSRAPNSSSSSSSSLLIVATGESRENVLSRELEEEKIRNSELTEDISRLISEGKEMTAYMSVNDDARGRLVEVEMECKKLWEEREEMRLILREEREEMMVKMKRIEEEKEVLIKELRMLSEDQDRKMERLQRREEEMARERQIYEEKMKKMQQYEVEVIRYKDTIRELGSNLDRQYEIVAELQSQNLEWQQKVDLYTQSMQDAAQRLLHSHRKYTEMKRIHQELAHMHQELKREYERMKMEYEQVTREHAEFKHVHQAWNQEHQELQREYAGGRHTNEDIKRGYSTGKSSTEEQMTRGGGRTLGDSKDVPVGGSSPHASHGYSSSENPHNESKNTEFRNSKSNFFPNSGKSTLSGNLSFPGEGIMNFSEDDGLDDVSYIELDSENGFSETNVNSPEFPVNIPNIESHNPASTSLFDDHFFYPEQNIQIPEKRQIYPDYASLAEPHFDPRTVALLRVDSRAPTLDSMMLEVTLTASEHTLDVIEETSEREEVSEKEEGGDLEVSQADTHRENDEINHNTEGGEINMEKSTFEDGSGVRMGHVGAVATTATTTSTTSTTTAIAAVTTAVTSSAATVTSMPDARISKPAPTTRRVMPPATKPPGITATTAAGPSKKASTVSTVSAGPGSASTAASIPSQRTSSTTTVAAAAARRGKSASALEYLNAQLRTIMDTMPLPPETPSPPPEGH